MYCSSSARNCWAMSRRSLPENAWSVSSRLANSSLLTNATVEFVNDFTAPEYAGNAARLSLTSNSPPRSYDMYRQIVLFHPNAFRHRRPAVAEHMETGHRFSFIDDMLSNAIPSLDNRDRARAPSAIGPCRQWTMRLQRTGRALGVLCATRNPLRVGHSAFHWMLLCSIRTVHLNLTDRRRDALEHEHSSAACKGDHSSGRWPCIAMSLRSIICNHDPGSWCY